MRQSTVAQEFIDEGRREGYLAVLVVALTERFGPLPETSVKTLHGMTELQFHKIIDLIFEAQSLAEMGL